MTTKTKIDHFYNGDHSKEGYDTGMGDRKSRQPKNKPESIKVENET